MKKILKMVLFISLLFVAMGSSGHNVHAIDTGRQDLGMLDTLKITNQFGQTINTNGANMESGLTYTLLYNWSLDEPTSDYRNKTAQFNIPSLFDETTIAPSSIPLYYDDNGSNIQIGVVSTNSTGLVTIQFNDNPILGSKSNIHGWLSITAQCGTDLGKQDVTIGWNGNNEDKISVNVIEQGIGSNKVAILNKYVRSGMVNSQPIVQQDENGRFYVTFSVEALISRNYDQLTIEDTVYAGMEVDPSSINVFSRPKDSSEYYSPSNTTYKGNYDTWLLANPTGVLAPNNNITADLTASNAITTSSTGFKIDFTSVDFDGQLASRQLTTTPLQMRYRIDYNVFLTGVNPNASLAEAQSMFESQNAKNDVALKYKDTLITETTWNKGISAVVLKGKLEMLH